MTEGSDTVDMFGVCLVLHAKPLFDKWYSNDLSATLDSCWSREGSLQCAPAAGHSGLAIYLLIQNIGGSPAGCVDIYIIAIKRGGDGVEYVGQAIRHLDNTVIPELGQYRYVTSVDVTADFTWRHRGSNVVGDSIEDSANINYVLVGACDILDPFAVPYTVDADTDGWGALVNRNLGTRPCRESRRWVCWTPDPGPFDVQNVGQEGQSVQITRPIGADFGLLSREAAINWDCELRFRGPGNVPQTITISKDEMPNHGSNLLLRELEVFPGEFEVVLRADGHPDISNHYVPQVGRPGSCLMSTITNSTVYGSRIVEVNYDDLRDTGHHEYNNLVFHLIEA
jgi:hypothetical protein